jgi:hypothetical protein
MKTHSPFVTRLSSFFAGPWSTRILSPSFPYTALPDSIRGAAIQLLAASLIVVTVVGCRGDRVPASTQALSDPPTTSPPQAGSGGSAAGSDTTSEANTEDPVIWERLGEWSGRGSSQTESFTGETGAFRIKWKTLPGGTAQAAPGKPPAGKPPPGKAPIPGTFKLTIHSAISGRPLQVAVDQEGPGADTAYVNEDPRVFFAVIDASNIEWSFSVDEAIGTRVTRKR